ncbi:helix-turn-helix domain-containing protein [Hymenobacter sp. GOD-10R]|uniref:helix-turn-helix domain-containing protein n=1 Tax=Hymenobacter sp. GOD-10R TaxID=3093922 RepID=UPI002D7652C9|nr:helix-turn-helix domain-containing protein [Hymenobacter sp. GOD-10R]WRQ29364.1 helix-turn-helix domain-containing protein [Hymenobacter sp. GOD-10R]
MSNPFESLGAQLSRIEANQLEVLQYLRTFQSPLPQVGGIELAQEVLRLSKPRIYALVSERAVPHMKRGNRLSFNRAELLQWIQDGHRAERKEV